MRVRNILIAMLLATLVAVPLASCQKSEQEAERLPESDDGGFSRSFTEMISFKLSNGISVYLQEDTTEDEVAIELLYRAGFCHEPRGKVQVSHLAEHTVPYAPTADYAAGEALATITKGGMIAAEALGDFSHFDFIVENARLEEMLKIASEQLTSLTFDEDTRKEQARKAAREISATLSSDRASLTKFGMMTLLQAIQHGEKFVPIEQMNYDLTIEDLTLFHSQHYRPNDMIIVIVGNIDNDDVRALIEKYFGAIPPSPEPPRYSVTLPGDMNVRWDIDASVAYLVYPGPFKDERERAALVAFGGYLNQIIANDPEMRETARASYTTNVGYPLNNLPFFVFVQPKEFRSSGEVSDKVAALIDEAIENLDETTFARVVSAIQFLINRSALEAHATDSEVANHVVIGQHALDVGIKHYLRNGRSTEEYNAMLESLTLEEMKQILHKYLSREQRRKVVILGG